MTSMRSRPNAARKLWVEKLQSRLVKRTSSLVTGVATATTASVGSAPVASR